MKRFAFLSFAMATLIAPIQVQAQQYDPIANCVRFPQIPNAEAETRYLLSHPGTRVCPGPQTDLNAQRTAVEQGAMDLAIANARLRCSMGGHVC